MISTWRARAHWLDKWKWQIQNSSFCCQVRLVSIVSKVEMDSDDYYNQTSWWLQWCVLVHINHKPKPINCECMHQHTLTLSHTRFNIKLRLLNRAFVVQALLFILHWPCFKVIIIFLFSFSAIDLYSWRLCNAFAAHAHTQPVRDYIASKILCSTRSNRKTKLEKWNPNTKKKLFRFAVRLMGHKLNECGKFYAIFDRLSMCVFVTSEKTSAVGLTLYQP